MKAGRRGAAGGAAGGGEPRTVVELLRFANHHGLLLYAWPDRHNPIPAGGRDCYPLVCQAVDQNLLVFDHDMPPPAERRNPARRSLYKLTRRGEAILTADNPAWRTEAIVRWRQQEQ